MRSRPLWLLALGACIASEPLPLPLEAADGALIFVIRDADQLPHVFAFEADQVPPLALSDEETFLLVYPSRLEELGLAPGAQPRPGEADPARPFPPGYQLFRSDERRETWARMTPEELEARIGQRPLLDVPSCESRGGCQRRRESSDYEFCELPCAEPPGPAAPAEPIPPELPDFSRCPAGWLSRASLAGDSTYCEPPALAACPTGSTHFLGDPGCTPVGASCPGDGWPAELPAGRTVRWVRPGGAGDGSSRSSPFGTIAAALAAAGPLDVLALSTGTHAGGAVIDRSLTIAGACAGTVIAGGAPGILIAPGATVELSNVSIAAAGDGIDVRGTAMLSGVTVSGGARGAYVRGTLIAHELLIRDAREGGIVAEQQAEVRLSRADLAGNTAYGVRLDGAAVGRFTNLVVRGSQASADQLPETRGFGVLARLGSKLVLTRSLFEKNRGNAMAAWLSSTASVTFAADRDGLGQYSFDTDLEARGEVSHLVTLRSPSGSVSTSREAQANVRHVYVQGSGGGLSAREGGRITANQVLLEDNSGVGVESSQLSNVILADVAIRDQALGASDTGQGVLVSGAALNADRIQIVRPTGHGIDVRGSAEAPGAATLSNVRVGAVRLRNPNALSFSCRADGSGLRVLNETTIQLTRGMFEGGARGIGFDSFDAHTLSDVTIRDTERAGLCAKDGSYDVERLTIENVAGIGIFLDGSYLEASHVAVIGTRAIPGQARSGRGVFLTGIQNIMDVRIASFPVSTFLLSGNEARGLHMDNGSEALLRDGQVAGSEVGIEVNQPSFDASSLYTNVIFRNNQQNLLVLF